MSGQFPLDRRALLARTARAGAALPLLSLSLRLADWDVDHPVPVDRRPKVLSRAMVFAHPTADPYDPSNHHGFNHAPSVVLLPDGRLLAAWFSGPFEASVNQVILGSHSSDRGLTWSPAEVLQDFPHKSDFDPAFIADGERTWLFFSAGRWNRYPFVRDEVNEVGVNSFSTYARYSDDSGRVWSPPVAVSPRHGSRSNGIKLSTGELLLPMEEFDGSQAGVLKSADRGRTWKLLGKITTPAGADEPSMAELRSGTIMMILRTTDGYLWKCFSKNKGETWSAPERTNIAAAATSANLLRLSDGRLILTHDESPRYRTPLTVRVSRDEGGTWDEPFVLAEIAVPSPNDPVWGVQVTYPSATELSDGTVVVVWSEIILADAEQYGDIRAARIQV